MNKSFYQNKFFISSVVLFSLVILVDWLVLGRSPQHEIHVVSENVKSLVQGKVQTSAVNEKNSKNQDAILNQDQVKDTQKKVEKFNPEVASEEQLNTWLNEEVQLMNQYNFDEQAITERYREITAKMKPEQFKVVASKLKESQSIPNEKVLAAFILSHAGYDSIQTLSDVISSPIVLDGEPTPHSAAETQSVREKALRVLVVNRLADLARVDQSAQAQAAKKELEKVIPTIKDSNLKNYAQSKLKEISSKK